MAKYYIGIDPGFTGAIGRISVDGKSLSVEDLPIYKVKKRREFDRDQLNLMVWDLAQLKILSVGLEDPTSRPGEGGERCRRFGVGIGLLEGLFTAHQIPYTQVPPNLWKGRLGLPGKDKPGANMAGAQLLVSYYPEAEGLVYGPRGGIKDGRLDALLIAHAVRTGVLK